MALIMCPYPGKTCKLVLGFIFSIISDTDIHNMASSRCFLIAQSDSWPVQEHKAQPCWRIFQIVFVANNCCRQLWIIGHINTSLNLV